MENFNYEVIVTTKHGLKRKHSVSNDFYTITQNYNKCVNREINSYWGYGYSTVELHSKLLNRILRIYIKK